MQPPPFRPALLPSAATWVGEVDIPFANSDPPPALDAEAGAHGRLRLADMDSHLHCSVIGTCLSTTELRKLMQRFIVVDGLSDLEVHHEAVRLASQNAELARSLHKALDRRHDASVQRCARAKDAAALATLWQQALQAGEVPGAYWALLTHRRATPELRQQVFGDVHMLSHLVGAANRADIRRLVALEQENAALRERADRQQEKLAELVDEREHERVARAAAERLGAQLEASLRDSPPAAADGNAAAAQAAAVALQTRRREDAENKLRMQADELQRLQAELTRLHQHAAELGRELQAAEAELRAQGSEDDAATSLLAQALHGQRVLYVGGRPSSSAAIRQLVTRHGAEYQRHDGGLEDRKGLLAPALAWATVVVFPVDCIDHDSALALKRSCQHQSRPFVPLRNASVASFAAAISAWARPASALADCGCGSLGCGAGQRCRSR